jgi:hypothetical protein
MLQRRAPSPQRLGADTHKEGFEDSYQAFWLPNILIKYLCIVLPKNRPPRRLKDDIFSGIPCDKLLLHLLGEIILHIFGFPETARQLECINECPIRIEHALPMFERVFFREGPLILMGTMAEERRKRRRDSTFCKEMECGKLLDLVVVGPDRPMARMKS